MAQVRLEARHGAQLAIDECDPPFLGTYPKLGQQIGHRAPIWKTHFHVGEASLGCFASVSCQSAVQPYIHSEIAHLSSCDERENTNIITGLQRPVHRTGATIYKKHLYFFMRQFQT